ncbi:MULTISPECIES: acyltransferase [Algibacter]|uniref:Transferase family hexapeptide repeat protein n=2 Tax=Algibacter TaxID=261827 RepID=A0A4R8MEX6_9FLAO|nr:MULTISPECIES: acyltransferase [Algibacter]MDN3664920.1 acyltransferase [Algibacter miyuki]MWW24426.1 acyltransferase [Algibacter lectus]TDY62445.1 transferase family hexapeptide repeat protein [Algibacter lectus]
MKKLYDLLVNLWFLKSKVTNFIKLSLFKVKTGKNLKINGGLFLKGRGLLEVGDDVTINSNYFFNPIGGQTFTSIVVGKNAKLSIGDRVGISNTAIYCAQEIVIKNNVLIGGDCKIYDTDFHSVKIEDRLAIPEQNIQTKPVFIASGVFIGTGSIILKGVKIGENSVVAAGSVVSKSIPANEIWGGNPIKFIKRII